MKENCTTFKPFYGMKKKVVIFMIKDSIDIRDYKKLITTFYCNHCHNSLAIFN